jgi:hypothetical protein
METSDWLELIVTLTGIVFIAGFVLAALIFGSGGKLREFTIGPAKIEMATNTPPVATATSQQTNESVAQPTSWSAPSSYTPTPLNTTASTSLCPTTISRELVEEWSKVGKTTKPNAQTYIDEFDEMRVNGEFEPQDTLPEGVLITTDFGEGESLIYQQYPVRPIVHYRSWGVFETTDEYKAVQSGSCMAIAP